MKSTITQFIEKLYKEKHADSIHCDVSSSRVHMINTPIPIELFYELETMSSEYSRDIQCLAGDFLTLALKEAIAHIPETEKKHLAEARLKHDREEAERHMSRCEFNAGGT